jgi:hypothetical protein
MASVPGSVQTSSGNKTGAAAAAGIAAAPGRKPVFVSSSLAPKRGQLTFASEGTEGGRFHSRKLQVPPGASGLTIGRGYDMSEKSPGLIVSDLTRAGVPVDDAKVLAKAHGLRGNVARKFIKDNKLESYEIGSDVQVRLFEISYAREAAEVQRISQKSDVVTKYGKVDFGKLDPAIRDLLVDLKFRGDYTSHARTLLQKAAVDNDLKKVQSVMGNKDNWSSVPNDRFNRRKELIDGAVKKKQLYDAPGDPLHRRMGLQA